MRLQSVARAVFTAIILPGATFVASEDAENESN